MNLWLFFLMLWCHLYHIPFPKDPPYPGKVTPIGVRWDSTLKRVSP